MSLSFIYPEALWLLLLLPAAAALGLAARRRLPHPRRWLSLVLRLVILASIILALAGAQIVRPADNTTTVFVIDASDSVSAAEQARAEEFIRQSLRHMPPGDQAAVVVFGENALVERLPSNDTRLRQLASVPATTRTDIAEAIQLGTALFPEDTEKRLILLSDGQENVGQARRQADLAAARGIEIDVVPLSPPAGSAEVILTGLNAPSGVRIGQRFELTAVIASTVNTTARLRTFGDNQLLDERTVQLTPGLSRHAIPLTAQERGFHRYRAQIETVDDTHPQNNQATAFVIIHGVPRVLIVAEAAEEAAPLASALEAAQLSPRTLAPAALPTSLSELVSYDSIVLVDVPAERLPRDTMAALVTFVRELGHGLVMVGGETSYGAGRYLRSPIEQALPVDMDVRSRTQEPNVALVMAVDKSGSMGRCHCDDPDGPSIRTEIGIPKVDIAKQAMIEASTVLGRLDYMGVVAFDEKARWALETQQLVSPEVLEASIAGIGAEGGTNIIAGLDQAFESLQDRKARIKHVILLTDGWTNASGYDPLVREMHARGITLSIVAAGRGSAQYLQRLTEAGGGKYYPATTLGEVPRIFLKETIRAVGSYIIEERFRPAAASSSPILRGMSASTLPALRGYNGTTPKDAAVVALVSPQGDPVLAHWQYGLGRTVAWTSDLSGRWAAEWLDWARFPEFAAQLVSWTLPAPQSQTLASDIRLDGSDAVITVEAFDASGRPRNFAETTAQIIAPDLSTTQVELRQTAAGRYAGRLSVSQLGAHLVQIKQSEDGAPVDSQTTGFVVPYSPEYNTLAVDTALLNELATATGGRAGIDPAEAFAPTLEVVEQSQPIWAWLLLLAALLFPLDVAVRRVIVTRRDISEVWASVVSRLRGQRTEEAAEPLLGELFEAKQRVGERRRRTSEDTAEVPPAAKQATPARVEREPTSEKDADEELDDDPLERLRRAKKRARWHDRS
ncbi:MAG: hypothetical protein MAG451_00244 [Anaerolineales bacterium]|nr:hypothetical protein [Anaerolineales bacterium]